MKGKRSEVIRTRVANEAALLLYTEQEKEYKQAKLRAAKTLGARVLPNNVEVAEALDKIAEEREGDERKKRLVVMREHALQIMKLLRDMQPKLIGSVWRGTTHRNSDIDIITFSDSVDSVLHKLEQSDYEIKKTEWQSVTKQGKKNQSFHIHLTLPPSDKVEIIVRGTERIGLRERCKIYGDIQTGLNLRQLQHALKTAPTQKFTPE